MVVLLHRLSPCPRIVQFGHEIVRENVECLLFVTPLYAPIPPKRLVHVRKGTVTDVVNETGDAHQLDVIGRDGGHERAYVFRDDPRKMVHSDGVLAARVRGGRVHEGARAELSYVVEADEPRVRQETRRDVADRDFAVHAIVDGAHSCLSAAVERQKEGCRI